MKWIVHAGLPLLIFTAPLFAEPPAYQGLTLGMDRGEAQAQIESRFPDSEPATFEDKKVTMVILKNPDEDHKRISLHFHPNGRLFGINVTLPLSKSEMLEKLTAQLSEPDRETKRGHSWDMGRYRVHTTVFIKGEITVKYSDRQAYDIYGRPWLDSSNQDE